ncbi:hypothetical protein ScPMuIL_011091 [Solemya velum]
MGTIWVIRQVFDAILAEFAEELIPCPKKPEWKNIAKQFSDRWQLHNCVGALDGKHIAIVSSLWWFDVPQLQGVPFHNPDGLGRRRLLVHSGRSRQQWISR